MIQRTLIRQLRVLSPSIRSAAPRTSLARPQFRPTPISLGVSRQAAARWYSSEPEAKKDEDVKGERESAEAEDPAKKDSEAKEELKAKMELDANNELEAKNKEILELKDRYLRSVAEFRNLQERTKRDMQSAKDFAIQKFAKDLVESIDNLDRALAMVPEEKINAVEKNEHVKDLLALYDGLKMTESILMNTLKKHGLERFDPSVDAEKFNPNEHEATFMTPVQGKEDNTVFLTQQKGFKLNGRILRAAKVGVVKNS